MCCTKVDIDRPQNSASAVRTIAPCNHLGEIFSAIEYDRAAPVLPSIIALLTRISNQSKVIFAHSRDAIDVGAAYFGKENRMVT